MSINHFYLLIININLFFCYLLTIGLKKISSPTELIYNCIKNQMYDEDKIIKYVISKNIILERLRDLTDQGILVNNNNIYSLTKTGKNVAKFFNFIKNKMFLNSNG